MRLIADEGIEGSRVINAGLDIGSTTTKVVALDSRTRELLFSAYRRHQARQAQSVYEILSELVGRFPHEDLRVCVCGSGAAGVARALGVPFVQEVVAGAIAVRHSYPSANCAIELGGQDAKMVFFSHDPKTGRVDIDDMRMNGSCAGGTGAFIDEMAALLKVPVEEFDALASKGEVVHQVSGRCGVYAKTDIQPLLNQGVPKADLALSAFHAIAKQTLGGLAQGKEVKGPVVFEGGPLTFNKTLVEVFASRIGLSDDELIYPEHPELVVAHGAALALEELFGREHAALSIEKAEELARNPQMLSFGSSDEGRSLSGHGPLFETEDELREFLKRHALPSQPHGEPDLLKSYLKPIDKCESPEIRKALNANAPAPTMALHVCLGVDCGSTTTKFALLAADGTLLDGFYAPNAGDPLSVAKEALTQLHERYLSQGIQIIVDSCGTTGYGEALFASALHADYHTVETVAHAHATSRYVKDATFILDIGGQDMKAIWLDGGVIKDIVVNEACSSGCGSFLEGFAASLGIEVDGIARAAFASRDPAVLGSRCTVFMNSSVVSEQRNGKSPNDIMAGLCRSIIENVFTKVVRIPSTDSLGANIVVQGGTFKNDAVLRAMELYTKRQVRRAPYPGLMGAIGIALLAKDCMAQAGARASSFLGFEKLRNLTWESHANCICPFCENHCMRTQVAFSDSTAFVTGNRCEKGEVIGELGDERVKRRLKEVAEEQRATPNLFDERERMLLRDWLDEKPLMAKNATVVGIPRVLAFWETMPFWRAFWKSLGFDVKVSRPSTKEMYERGLPSVTSDTICFPAKLVHGHVRDLVDQGADRIFMPIITAVFPELGIATSESMCAVVKGYPMVEKSSDDPEARWGVAYDMPLFHWHTPLDRERQLCDWAREAFGIDRAATIEAIKRADAAQAAFELALLARGREVLENARRRGTYAVVLAARPYHNDPLVNHGLPALIAKTGHAVLPCDAVGGLDKIDLGKSRLDIVNNFHARELACALRAAGDDALEYVMMMSFGCGHDAYLSDEAVRLMQEASGKTPLILKVDETDAAGPLRIRVRSFVDTIDQRRAAAHGLRTRELADPYPVKFEPSDRNAKVILVPNTSHAFARLMSAAIAKKGFRAEALDIGREEAIRLGKRYVHNDVCFPAQITVGEALCALESGKYDGVDVAMATGKYIGDCRLTHYAAFLRKALDDAGYAHVPIVTNDDVDSHDLHPGFRLGVLASLRIALGLPMIDALEDLLRRMRPYELVPGASQRAFDAGIDAMMRGLASRGFNGMKVGFSKAIDLMCSVDYDRSAVRPRVLIVGEYLLNFHPGANRDIEAYLEQNGMEVIEARMTDVIRKTYFYQDAQVREFGVKKPFSQRAWLAIVNRVFDLAHDVCDKIASKHPLYEPPCRMPDLVKASDPIVHHTFDAGEGVLIPAEILHHAARGCRAFLILGPFGCLPNHIVGRGIAKQLKAMYPDAQILALDYDPDVSFANVENRLQMLIMNAKA